MHTGVISFCDRIGYNIKSSDVKDNILNDLDARFQLRVLQKHWMRVDPQQMKYILSTPHSMCLRSNGNPYFMYFTRYEDTNTIFFVDKKVHPGYEKPRILLARGRFDDSVFLNHTVLDGEMVKDSYGQWVFLINDVLAYNNRALVNETLADRLKHAYHIFEKCYEPDTCMDACIYQIKQYLPVSQRHMEQLIELNHRLPYTNRGIYFYPHSMRFKPKLYNFNEELIQAVSRKVKDTPEFRVGGASETNGANAPMTKGGPSGPALRGSSGPALRGSSGPASMRGSSGPASMRGPPSPPLRLPDVPPTYAEGSDGLEEEDSSDDPPALIPERAIATPTLGPMSADDNVFYLRKTENPDIYELYRTNMMQNKVGIACIPSLDVSKKLRMHFRERTVAMMSPWRCVYNQKFQKWQPEALLGAE